MLSNPPITPSFTEAQLPLASSVAANSKIFNSTYSVEMMSDGTRWIPLAPFTVYSASLADEVTGTIAITPFREIELPFKYIGKNGAVKFHLASENTNNANGKEVKVYLNDGATEFKVYDSTTTTSGRVISKTIPVAGTEYNFWVSNNSSALGDSSGSNPSYQQLAPTDSLKLKVSGRVVNSADSVSLTRLFVQIMPSF